MNPEVQKLEGLLARIAKNRAIPRAKAPSVGPVQAVAPHQRTVTQDLVPVAHAPKPAPAAPAPAPAAVAAKSETPMPAVKAAAPMPAPAAPIAAKAETPTPAVKAETPMPAPAAPKPPLEAQPTYANLPAAAKKPEAKTIELEVDDLPEEAMRDSEPEIELVPLAAKADRPTPEPLSPFDEPDEPEIEEVASSDEPVVVLDDEPEDAEIIEPPKGSQTPIAAKESVSDIEITIEPSTLAPSTRPAPAPAPVPEPSTVASFDEASFADVDMDEPAPAAPPPKAETVTPLEAAVRSAQAAPSPAVIEAAGVVEKPKDVVRVVAPAKPVASQTFGSLMKRSLGLRLR